jgi:hypothetical protein
MFYFYLPEKLFICLYLFFFLWIDYLIFGCVAVCDSGGGLRRLAVAASLLVILGQRWSNTDARGACCGRRGEMMPRHGNIYRVLCKLPQIATAVCCILSRYIILLGYCYSQLCRRCHFACPGSSRTMNSHTMAHTKATLADPASLGRVVESLDGRHGLMVC